MSRRANENKQMMINEVIDLSSNGIVSRLDILNVCAKYGVSNGYLNFMTTKSAGRGQYDISEFMNQPVSITRTSTPVEPSFHSKRGMTDEEIVTDQRKRFKTLDRMIEGVVNGSVRAVIVSGPAGIGKTYTIELALDTAAREGKIRYEAIKGFVKATGLFRALWENREKDQVILLDDADSAFQDADALSMLKVALDSSQRRVISWRSEKNFKTEVGDDIPKSFDYKGSIVFITNLNFEKMIESSKTLAPHLSALVSRSFYLDLNISSRREQMLRIFDVLDNSMMVDDLGLCHEKTVVIKNFISSNVNLMRETSLRMVVKLARVLSFATSNDDFMEIATATCLKNRH